MSCIHHQRKPIMVNYSCARKDDYGRYKKKKIPHQSTHGHIHKSIRICLKIVVENDGGLKGNQVVTRVNQLFHITNKAL